MKTTTHTKAAKPEESYDEWLLRTSLEAEAEANEKGWLSTEQVEASMAKHKLDFYKKHRKAT